jgi:uncharacterized membrane protein YfcA
MDLLSLAQSYGPFVVAMAFAGVVGGLLAGLLGVGGGIVIVPVLFSTLGTLGISDDLAIKVAVATSLATIVVTSVSSARSHYKCGTVDLDLLRAWGPWIVVGVVLGTVLANLAKGWVMTLVFGIVALLVAINMILRAHNGALRADFPSTTIKNGSATFVGAFSAIMGIGGGTLSVPTLTAFGFDIKRSVGTAAAIGFLIAVPATLGYIIGGWSAPDRPPFSIGYVNLIAFMALVPLTTLCAPLGARLAHALPGHILSYAFAVFLLLTSARMLWSVWAN